jgi:hypothetical protein
MLSNEWLPDRRTKIFRRSGTSIRGSAATRCDSFVAEQPSCRLFIYESRTDGKLIFVRREFRHDHFPPSFPYGRDGGDGRDRDRRRKSCRIYRIIIFLGIMNTRVLLRSQTLYPAELRAHFISLCVPTAYSRFRILHNRDVRASRNPRRTMDSFFVLFTCGLATER